jgi:hypothetical protein
MATFIKFLIIILLSTMVVASEEKKDEVLVCVRWQWRGAPFEGKVSCIEWAKKDCSNRMYPELCKLGG